MKNHNSDTHVYLVWQDNKTGNWEVKFARSSDNGKTFEKTINLSNSPNDHSDRAVRLPDGKKSVYFMAGDE